MAESFDFVPASEFTDRHGLFIAVIGDTTGYGVAAAKQAMDDAGYKAATYEQQCRLGVLVGAGIGGLLFGETAQLLLHEASPPRFLIVEVDSPREASPDQATRLRRQQFYRRVGCLRFDWIDYILPLPGKPRSKRTG